MIIRYSAIIVAACLLGCGDNPPPTTSVIDDVAPGSLSFLEGFRDSSLAAAVASAGQALQPEADSLTLLALSEVTARGQGIADLGGIERLVNLRVLVLGDNRISDLRPLSGLHHLRQLDLENNRVTDLIPLTGLDSLTALILDYNQVADPTPLLQLPALQSLSLRDNPIPPARCAEFVSVLMARGVWVDAAASDTSRVEEVPASGERLALVNGNTLYLAAPDTGTSMLLLRIPAGLISDPVWSIDGRQLAFAVHQAGGSSLYIIDGAKAQATRVTGDRRSVSSPTWSADGQRLAFASDRNGDLEIYTIATEGGDWYRLTDNPARDEAPDWSPDGQWLAFTSDREGHSGLYLMRPDGSGVRKLETELGEVTEPAWSPDGAWIAFLWQSASRYQYQDLHIIRSDGTGERCLTTYKAARSSPCWTPDGKLAFRMGVRAYLVSLGELDGRPVGPPSLFCSSLAWSPAMIYGFTQEVQLPVVLVSFADSAFQRAVQEALGISGQVTATDAGRLVELSARARGIASLSGIEALYRLRQLDINNPANYVSDGRDGELPDTTDQTASFNRVTDLSPLASLAALADLNISLNPVSDLSPLANLASLYRLYIDDCPVHDLAPLSQLSHLGSLTLRHLQVSDLSPLAGLAQLWELQVNWTQVEDVSPLAGLRRLVRLDLAHNRISDIGPLVTTAATEVWLAGNPLSEESLTVHVPALRARGMVVHLE